MDFNIRDVEEMLYIDEFSVERKLDLFLQEIDIVLYTPKGSILGQRDFGFDIEELLWQTTYNAGVIENAIKEQIVKNCSMSKYFNYKVTFGIMRGINRDIGDLTITISSLEDTQVVSQVNYVFK